MNLSRVFTPLRAVAAGAVALLVTGLGAAVGMASTHHAHRSGAGSPATAAVPSGSAVAPAASSTVPASSTTSAAATTTTRPAPVNVAGAGRTGAASQSGPVSTATTAGAVTAPHTSAGSGAGGGSAGTPPVGTYTYATSGSETFMSKTSQYPPTTTIDVADQGCGISAKWNSSPGNSTTVVECPVPGGIRVVAESSTVDENGYKYTQTFTCPADAFVPTTTGTPGQTWTWSCTASNGETSHQVVKLIGPESETVAGAPVRTEHVQIVTTLSGPESGSATTDYWLTANATPVREVGSIDASAFGVTYTAHYTLELQSLTPTA